MLPRRLGHRFARPDLLEQALTHSSATHESGGHSASNETLEFLGDAVLGLVVADLVFERLAGRGEGELSRQRASLVSRPALAALARELDLGPHLRLGRGEERAGGRERDSMLADACEAVLGALYLDGGLGAVARLVRRRLEPALRRGLGGDGPTTDAKSALQELLQRDGGVPPVYRGVTEEGPPHARRFRVEVRHGRRRLGTGEGSSRRQAEQRAAEAALARLSEGAGRR